MSASAYLSSLYEPYHDPSLTINLRGLKPKHLITEDMTRRERTISHWLPITDQGLDAAQKTAEAWCPKWDVYVGVYPRTGHKGDMLNVPQAAWLYVEFDDATIPLFKDIPAPNLVVASGRGTHAYYRLTKPVDISNGQRQHFGKLITRLVHHVGGDTNVHDIARILRVPGTINHKYDPARGVRLLYNDPTSDTRPVEWWDDYLPRLPEAMHIHRTQRHFDRDGLPQRWIDEMATPALPGEWNKNMVRYSVRMRKIGTPMEVIEMAMETYAAICGKTDRVHEMERRRLMEYIEHRVV